jgi:hypothetical protein
MFEFLTTRFKKACKFASRINFLAVLSFRAADISAFLFFLLVLSVISISVG